MSKKQPKKDKNGKLVYETETRTCSESGCDNTFEVKKTSQKKYCKSCLSEIRKRNLKKARAKRKNEKLKEELKNAIVVKLPGGDRIKVRNEFEKNYIKDKLKSFTKDYNFENSADISLLGTMLRLELQVRQISDELNDSYSESKVKMLTKCADKIRMLEKDLGINRTTRMKNNKEDSVENKIDKTLKKYKGYRKRNKDKFIVYCPNCKHRIKTNREITDELDITKFRPDNDEGKD